MSEFNDNPNGELGYGNPPKATRFRKGVSGNPSGRPSGVRNWETVLYRVAQKKTIINENGEPRTLTNREAIFKQLVDTAKSGDLAAMRIYFHLEAMAAARFSDFPKARIDKTGNGNGGTVSDPDAYVIPNGLLAQQSLALFMRMMGLNSNDFGAVVIITTKQANELAVIIRDAYGFPVTPEEATRLASDGILIKAAEAGGWNALKNRKS